MHKIQTQVDLQRGMRMTLLHFLALSKLCADSRQPGKGAAWNISSSN
jgi:hypothetical protein